MRTYGIIKTGGELFHALRAVLDSLLKDGDRIIEEYDVNPYIARNKILKNCDNGTVFLIDDHLCPTDTTVFDEYEEIMQRFGQSVVFYGYAKEMNRILSGKPVPGLMVKTDQNPIHIARMPCDYLIGINRNINKELFDESFKKLGLDEFINRCAKRKLLPYNGFYIDINNSWDRFKENPVNFNTQQEFEISKHEFRVERDLLNKNGWIPNTDNNVNVFIEFLRNKLMEKF